ncbi:MAG: hypothetical protein AAF628_22760 [Planctomycetota bacterium]
MKHLAPPSVCVPALVLGLVFSAQLSAQTTVVMPPGYDAVEGNSGGNLAGFSARFRQQILLRGTWLSPYVGRDLTGLWFRRDDQWGKALPQSHSHLRIELSRAALPTTAPARVFAHNRGLNPIEVFDGAVLIGASSQAPIPAPWATPDAVHIPFTTHFPYTGGDLCIEIDGTPLDPPLDFVWWVDYVHEADVGVVRRYGQACGEPALYNQWTATAWGRDMVPGSTFHLGSVGWANTPAVLMLGDALASPFPLDFLGATGCALHILPKIVLPAGVYPTTPTGSDHTVLYAPIHVPARPTLVGAPIAVQWINLELTAPRPTPAGFITTNGMELTLGQTMPPGNISIVKSSAVDEAEPFPDTGYVSVSRGPVLQLDVR